MDPISQGVLGATAAQAFGPRSLGRHNAWIGWLAGMAADLDVLIRSPDDPLVAIEYHRHFTHSVAFVPVGTLVVALLFWALFAAVRRWRAADPPTSPAPTFAAIYLSAGIAYLTHGPLDACTSYGTLLLWPFSDHRVAWDWLPVVDPLITIALLIGFASSLRQRRRRGAMLALGCFALYTCLGALLHARAEAAAYQLAAARGDQPLVVRAMPKLPTILVWRSVYTTDDRLHVDTLRVIPGQETTYSTGGSRPRFFPSADLPPALARDIAIFQWFAQDFTAPYDQGRDRLDADRPGSDGVSDLRFGPSDEATPIWGLTWDPAQPVGSLRHLFRPTRHLTSELSWTWRVLLGRDPSFVPLP